jgi:hypothetical protein
MAMCVLGALLLASPAAARGVPQTQSTDVLPSALLSHKRALRLIVESAYGWWFDDTLVSCRAKVNVVLLCEKRWLCS